MKLTVFLILSISFGFTSWGCGRKAEPNEASLLIYALQLTGYADARICST